MLSFCWTSHFPNYVSRGIPLTLHKLSGEGVKAASALLTACLLQLSATWGSLTPVILVAMLFSQFPLAGFILASQAKRKKVTTDLTTELCKSGIINLIHTLQEFHLWRKTHVCQFKVTWLDDLNGAWVIWFIFQFCSASCSVYAQNTSLKKLVWDTNCSCVLPAVKRLLHLWFSSELSL